MSEKLGLDEEDCAEILSLFIETTISDLDALGRAIEKGDPALAVESAHSIKGASATLGFDKISSLAAEVEMKARKGVLDGAEGAANLMRDHIEGVKGSV